MYRKVRKLPTLIGLLIIFAGIGLAIYSDNTQKQILTSAKDYSPPSDIQFSNITDTSITVSYLTENAAISFVEVVNNLGFKETFLDDLDSDNIPRPRTAHLTTIKNLKEDSTYKIRLRSGGNKCLPATFCPTLTQKTALRLKNTVSLPPVHGKLVTKEGKAAESSIIYLRVGKSALLSGRVDSLGIWVIPLNNLRSQDLITKPEINETDLIQITAKLSPKDISEAVIDVKSIQQNLSLPTMELGKSYNLISLLSKKDILAKISSQNILGSTTDKNYMVLTPSPTINPQLDILFPRSELDTTPDKRPRLRGIGKPGSELKITVYSTPQSSKVRVNSDGTWTFRPFSDLTPGIHTILVEGIDSRGKPISLTKKFVVLKSGEGVLGESTPSASLTPVSTTAPSPTPTSEISVSVTPLPSPFPSNTPTSIPPSPTSPPATPPKSGNTSTTLLIIGGGISLLVLGMKFLSSL